MKIILYLISALVLCSLSIIDNSNPEEVLKEYITNLSSENDLVKIYDELLCEESKNLLNKDEFVKIHTSKYKNEIKYLDRNIIPLPLDNNKSTYRRFMIKEKASINEKVFFNLAYFTLKNENGKWKIIWTKKLFFYGDDQLQKGDYIGAIQTYEKIVAINPYSGNAYRRIADCYTRLDKYDECLRYCKLAITNEPENPDVYNSFAGYYGKVSNYIMGINYLERGLTYCLNESQKGIFYGNISNYYIFLKDYSKAEKNIQSAIKSDSNYAFSWFIYGKIKHNENQVNLAKKYYKKAISSGSMDSQFQYELFGNYASCLLVDKECDSAKKYSMKALDIIPDSKSVQEIYQKANNCN
jgi:tetratricopeptide (TPR) repeat protein